MTSLEFIEKEIKQLEERKENAFKNEYYSVYKECSQKITALQQIKSELEAWEVVKKFIIDSNGVYLLRLDSDDDYDNEYYQILKKALEVEDES